MKINKAKLAAGTVITGLTATGWGLYGAKANETPEKMLSSEEALSPSPIIVQPTPVEVSLGPELKQIISDNKKMQWEIYTRDAMIDYKNGEIDILKQDREVNESKIDKLNKSTIDLVKKQIDLWKQIKEWEKYADENEEYMDYLEKQIEELKKQNKSS